MPNEKTLVINHSIHKLISEEEIKTTIQQHYGNVSFEIVEVIPLEVAIKESYKLNFLSIANQQRTIFFKEIRPKLNSKKFNRVAYFGAAPIPLAIQLGYLFEDWADIDVFQQHHQTNKWTWEKEAGELKINASELPDQQINANGEIALRISSAVKISPVDTQVIIPNAIIEVDIELDSVGSDVIKSIDALKSIADQFKDSLDNITSYLPQINAVHLFCAIPTGLAFMLGTKVSPTIHPLVITYQFAKNQTPTYREAISLQIQAEEFLEYSEEEKTKALKIRKQWNKHLTKKIRTFIINLEKAKGKSWYEKLGFDPDQIPLLSSPFWNNLPSITSLNLKNESVHLGAEDAPEGFNYNADREWVLGDSFLIPVGKTFTEEADQNRAARQFLFHETLHFGFHRLTANTVNGIGNFPRVLEEADYQADIWAVLHEFGFAGYEDAGIMDKPRDYFLICIDTALKTMWSFYPSGSLAQIQIRRVNRFLIWYWQYLRIQQLTNQADLNDCLNILLEKPLLELFGPEIISIGQRTFYKLKSSKMSTWEMCVFHSNKVQRLGQMSNFSIEKLFQGFREKNSEMLKKELSRGLDQLVVD